MHFYLQVPKKRTDKENCNPNLQNTLLSISSPNRILGPSPSVISSNAHIAAARNNRMFKAMVSHNLAFSSCSPAFSCTSIVCEG